MPAARSPRRWLSLVSNTQMTAQAPDVNKLGTLGNLGYAVDFRAVYQEILGSHLGVSGRDILGQTFDRIPFVRDPAKSASTNGALVNAAGALLPGRNSA